MKLWKIFFDERKSSVSLNASSKLYAFLSFLRIRYCSTLIKVGEPVVGFHIFICSVKVQSKALAERTFFACAFYFIQSSYVHFIDIQLHKLIGGHCERNTLFVILNIREIFHRRNWSFLQIDIEFLVHTILLYSASLIKFQKFVSYARVMCSLNFTMWVETA